MQKTNPRGYISHTDKGCLFTRKGYFQLPKNTQKYQIICNNYYSSTVLVMLQVYKWVLANLLAGGNPVMD